MIHVVCVPAGNTVWSEIISISLSAAASSIPCSESEIFNHCDRLPRRSSKSRHTAVGSSLPPRVWKGWAGVLRMIFWGGLSCVPSPFPWRSGAGGSHRGWSLFSGTRGGLGMLPLQLMSAWSWQVSSGPSGCDCGEERGNAVAGNFSEIGSVTDQPTELALPESVWLRMQEWFLWAGCSQHGGDVRGVSWILPKRVTSAERWGVPSIT